MKIDSQTGSVYHCFRDLIRVLSLNGRGMKPIRSRTYLTLPYFARCFNHALGGLFVTGGLDNSLAKLFSMKIPNLTGLSGSRRKHDGLFSVYSPAMASELTYHLGEMINNAVTIYPDANSTASYTSYVCNNDSSLYLVSISDSGIRLNRSIICEPNVSLNKVMQSPDRSFLATTGDSGSIFLIDPSLPKATIESIRTNNDLGFGLSFHPDQHTLASAFQNGSCLLYDLRKPSRPYHEIKSTRPNQQSGAFRSCKFLSSPTQDLLAILEHVGRVHLIDLRNLEKSNHQVVVFPLALDQFSRYKTRMRRLSDQSDKLLNPNTSVGKEGRLEDLDFLIDGDEPDHLVHPRWEIFGDAPSQFTAPLVYDFDYLTGENPQLFKCFKYEPPSFPQVNSNNVSDELSTKSSVSMELESEVGSETPLNAFSDDSTSTASTSTSQISNETQRLRRHFHDSYMQSGNHVNGEMQLSGFDWYENLLIIGSEDGGLSEWDVNVRGRRSFGSFSYA